MCTTCGCSGIGNVTYTGVKIRETAGTERSADATATATTIATGDSGIRYRPVAAGAADRSAPNAHAHADPHSLHQHQREHQQAKQHPGNSHAALHAERPATTIALAQQILAKNQQLAERNRGWFAGCEILAINLMSSPGAGKTTLLERTIRDLAPALSIQVIEGDQATLNDAERIRATGASVVQINTGTGCHLEADMLARALQQLQPPPGSVVMIENVGNLVCPALFDLGERAKVVVLSVTEGEDKPVKYPHMFRAADVLLLNKIDLLPYLAFDIERCVGYAMEVNPNLQVFRVSATSGEGLEAWYGWLRAHAEEARAGTELIPT